MELTDFQRLLFLADHNLSQDILLGYHTHDNLQQAYENARYLTETTLMHDIVVDASVHGIGKGAGNLSMELFASYLNTHCDKSYDIKRFLEIIDEDLKSVSPKYRWHPNYASYFADKGSLSYQSMEQLLASLPDNIKISFSKETAEYYYREFTRRKKNLSNDPNKNGNATVSSPWTDQIEKE